MKLKVDIMIGINFDMDINFCNFIYYYEML